MKISTPKLLASILAFSASSISFAECTTQAELSEIDSKIVGVSSGTLAPNSAAPGTNTVSEAKDALTAMYNDCSNQLIKASVDQAVSDIKESLKSSELKEKEKAANKQFFGLNYGVGLALTSVSGTFVKEAKVIDGVVRVTEELGSEAIAMLETHYFLKTHATPNMDFGHGPFAAITAIDKEGDKIGAFGAGWMFGFKDSNTDGGSWNLGLGYYVDTQAKKLGSGVVEGQALPGTETKIRFREVDATGWMIMLSSTF